MGVRNCGVDTVVVWTYLWCGHSCGVDTFVVWTQLWCGHNFGEQTQECLSGFKTCHLHCVYKTNGEGITVINELGIPSSLVDLIHTADWIHLVVLLTVIL